MQNPMYVSPQVPQMVTPSPYFSGPSPYMLPQPSSVYYPPMAGMQSTGPLNYSQPYPPVIQRQRGMCEYSCCTCCLAFFASICCCCCCDDDGCC